MSRIYKFRGRIVRESSSGLAVLADIDMHPEEVWLPKSGFEYDPETRTFEVEDWLARQKDLPI